MIIFDLDGTLADCEHRRHFVDPGKKDDCYSCMPLTLTQSEGWYYKEKVKLEVHPQKRHKFKPDWKSFFEACDKDTPIKPVIEIFHFQMVHYKSLEERINWQIWSGRCESVKEKTIKWLENNLRIQINWDERLKMRPVGDSTPDDVLKMRWLDEAIAEGKTIDYVFDDRKKVCDMWRRRGIFVFNCCQHDKEF